MAPHPTRDSQRINVSYARVPLEWDPKTHMEIARGVEMQGDYHGNVTLIFKNPEYGKIFAQANRFPY